MNIRMKRKLQNIHSKQLTGKRSSYLTSKFRSVVIFTLAAIICIATDLSAQSPFSLEDIFIRDKFSPKTIDQFKFIDGEHYITQENDTEHSTSKIWKHRLADEQKTEIFDSKVLKEKFTLKNAVIQKFEQIEDHIFLVGFQSESIYRYSSKAQYYFVDIRRNLWYNIAEGQKIMYPTLSPYQDKIAYVLDNNIYILNLKNLKTEQITKDGLYNHIINGASDWAYEEEFFVINTMCWSPDGHSLAYLKFDESKVKEYTIDLYRNDYPTTFRYKYPRAGEEISAVSAWIYSSKKQHIKIPLEADYLPKMRWKDSSTLTVMTLNRLQNDMQIRNYNIRTKEIKVWYQEQDKKYIELPDFFRILPEGQLAITSETSGYRHLYFVDEHNYSRQITSGQFDVKDILRIDLDDSVVVFSAHLPSPERKSVLLWDMKRQSLSYLTDTNGTVSVTMLGNGSFIEKFSNQQIRSRIAIKSLKNNISKILLEDVREEDSVLVKKEFFWMPVNDYVLRAWKMYPPHFDSTGKYPVLFYVYGGPGMQTVTNSWGNRQEQWLNYMANQGYIIVSVDNRGTESRGTDFRKMTYAKLGQYETEDQLAAIRYMNTLPYVDSSKISMFGWSFGGYLTLMCMMQKDSLLRGGISVAPVTDWRYYNAVYTEKYMRSPIANPVGYNKGAPVHLAENLTGELLLIHGTADDNVHFQNSLELIKKLVYHNKRFQMIPYTNGTHGIGGPRTQLQLYGTFTDFLMKIAKENNTESTVIECELPLSID